MKSICVITSSRADFGIQTPLIRRIHDDPELKLRLVVTGSHLSAEQGMTVREIEAQAFPIAARIPILDAGSDTVTVSSTMARALLAFSHYLALERPDLAVVLGDRYEIFAICAALTNARIPIAHLHGGETTEGAVDECFRHGITKMSYLHFAGCETYRKRIIQLGEAPERVFNVGALSIENLMKEPGAAPAELSTFCGFDVTQEPFALVTFHPVTLEADTALDQLNALIAAMQDVPEVTYLITMANVDADGERINNRWREVVVGHPNRHLVPSLGMRRYVTALRQAECMIGNSSSGLTEAPAAHLPTVNIGDRQRGRLQSESVINCPPEKNAIVRAIRKALSPEFQQISKAAISPYGSGNTSLQITRIIKDFLYNDKIDLKKKFYDIKFEVNK